MTVVRLCVEAFELQEEVNFCEAAGIFFASLNIVDRDVPKNAPDARKFIRMLGLELSAGKNALVHCRQGIGRSGLIAIAVLLTLRQNLNDAVALVTTARGREVPETADQLVWLRSFAPDL
jgi:protein-tyrosine phosphatase